MHHFSGISPSLFFLGVCCLFPVSSTCCDMLWDFRCVSFQLYHMNHHRLNFKHYFKFNCRPCWWATFCFLLSPCLSFSLFLCHLLAHPPCPLSSRCPPPFTHPSPQSAHSSTLTPQNYTNSLSGRQYEWRDGGRKGRQICLCSTTQRCLYSAPSQLSADKSIYLNRKTNHPVNLLISKCMYFFSLTDWDDSFLDLHRFLWDYSVILWLSLLWLIFFLLQNQHAALLLCSSLIE